MAQILDPEASLVEMNRCASRNIVGIRIMDAVKIQQLAAHSLTAQARYKPSDFNVDRLHECYFLLAVFVVSRSESARVQTVLRELEDNLPVGSDDLMLLAGVVQPRDGRGAALFHHRCAHRAFGSV
ncbi:hypothetical protein HW09_33560 [Pseudomonas aeruginosa]|nr:hypothetical protein HW09_33560 [Pseudomonas aeruginosa]